ncbi:MAG: alpha-amylase family glycosyl hydrolase [Pseudomonadota bacterium]
MRYFAIAAFSLVFAGSGAASEVSAPPENAGVGVSAEDHSIDPRWANATIYFLLTDRFRNGDPSNDTAYGRQPDGDTLRSFMGGDIAGVIEKLEEGYFTDLGVDAIWTTPVIEQIRQPYEEYGRSYSYHGYWPRDWTGVDQAYGSEADFARMVEAAHSKGIRVIVDVIINHAGPPINEIDPPWPEDWVRTDPICDWQSFAGVATCLIVPALQDIRTESDDAVDLPPHIIAKWEQEGRLDQELRELDAFFERTELPRAPQNYIIKWLTDWVREYGVDGFRVDTAKHVDPEVWRILKSEAALAFDEWKAAHSEKVLDDRPFYMVGEVFNFGAGGFENAVAGTRDYDYGDIEVDFFDYGFDALINMGFATHASLPTADLFQFYADQMQGPFSGAGLVNYIDSHDDPKPLDPARKNAYENAIKLMLAPGAAQIYYGDEISRSLIVEGTRGDATLRSFMNWEALETEAGRAMLSHWQRLGQFRQHHLAVGAGRHEEHSWTPYVFSRRLEVGGHNDAVVVALSNTPINVIEVHGVFAEGQRVRDAYHGGVSVVEEGQVRFEDAAKLFLLEAAQP